MKIEQGSFICEARENVMSHSPSPTSKIRSSGENGTTGLTACVCVPFLDGLLGAAFFAALAPKKFFLTVEKS